MRVFLDANVLFSAAKSVGAVRELLKRLEESGHQCCVDAYVIEEKDGTSTRVGAAFYPYRDGALVELVLLGRSRGSPATKSLDWAATLAAVKAKLDGIAND